jgi:hypothetical protein
MGTSMMPIQSKHGVALPLPILRQEATRWLLWWLLTDKIRIRWRA